jgi:alpha-tubulin suppressor-like RCC1 family protein
MRTARLAGSAWLVAACAVAAATLLVVGCSEARPSQATPTLTPSAAVTGTVPTLTTGPSRSPEIVLPSLALTPAPSPSPQQTPPPSLQPSSNTAITAGAGHSCALRADGTVWCWGGDGTGALGDGTRGDTNHLRLVPVQVVQGNGQLTGVTEVSSSVDALHTCALEAAGTVWCWGDDYLGQLGDGTTGDANQLRLEPVQVVQGNGKLTDVKAITTGEAHTCALKADGTVWCWGDYFYGQLGDGTMDNADAHLTPVQVVQGSGLLTDVEAIAAGLNHTCALKTDATIWCWGDDSSGQLGDGTTGDENQLRLEPVQVIGLS